MRILAIDDEENALEELVYEIREVTPETEILSFTSSMEALEYAERNVCNIAFVDISMPQIDGISLAKRMKINNPNLNIVFVTGYDHYGVDACNLHASGYILKPVTKEAVLNEMNHLRYPVHNMQTGIRAVTFGEFEMLISGEQVKFGRSKSKEMLAYLIDQHGRSISKKEIALILFEDQEYTRSIQDYMKKIIAELRATLASYEAEEMLRKGYNSYAVNPGSFTCDLYEYEKGEARAINAFHGKYMSQYSWSEETLGTMTNPYPAERTED